MKIAQSAAIAAAALALSVAAFGVAQSKVESPGTPGAAMAPMPKTDRITMADFKKLAAAGNVVIIDVRSTEAYQSGHIPGALSVPEETINAAVALKLKKMGKPIATYCS